jgi:hypothetical protein
MHSSDPFFLWQMASDRTTPTASGNGARIPLGNEGEGRGRRVRLTFLHLR